MKYKSIKEEAEECRKAFVGRDYIRGGPRVYAWHVHHEVLAEHLSEPIENRIAFILECKPISERAIRLRWMRPVMAPVPNKVVKAWEAWGKALEAYDKAEEVYWEAEEALDEAGEASNKAREAYGKAWEAWLTPELHDKELPGCPWDGRTIFR